MTVNRDFAFFESVIKELFIGVYAKRYNRLDEWSSMQSLIVVSAIDEHFDVILEHPEMKQANSLEELHEIVLQKID